MKKSYIRILKLCSLLCPGTKFRSIKGFLNTLLPIFLIFYRLKGYGQNLEFGDGFVTKFGSGMAGNRFFGFFFEKNDMSKF